MATRENMVDSLKGAHAGSLQWHQTACYPLAADRSAGLCKSIRRRSRPLVWPPIPCPCEGETSRIFSTVMCGTPNISLCYTTAGIGAREATVFDNRDRGIFS